MNRSRALLHLGFNFLRDMLASGWGTARIILFRRRTLHPGFATLAFDDLPDHAANLVAALITLTPGTTTVDIDLQRRTYRLHVLDLDQAERTLDGIRRDFIAPARILFGGRA